MHDYPINPRYLVVAGNPTSGPWLQSQALGEGRCNKEIKARILREVCDHHRAVSGTVGSLEPGDGTPLGVNYRTWHYREYLHGQLILAVGGGVRRPQAPLGLQSQALGRYRRGPEVIDHIHWLETQRPECLC